MFLDYPFPTLIETAFSQEPNWKGPEPLIHTNRSMTTGRLTGQVFRWRSSFLDSEPFNTLSQEDQSYMEYILFSNM